MKITIGMPSYKNFNDVWYTAQALRLYQRLGGAEVLIVDNCGCSKTEKFVNDWGGDCLRYVLDADKKGTAAAKNAVFRHATGDFVLCIDSHCLLVPGTIERLASWATAHTPRGDLYHGPLIYDDIQTMTTRMDPVWRGQMWGIWGGDPIHPEADPVEIPMMGMGLFGCYREDWLGFNDGFRGFGGEEGYIHEKFRQHGGRVMLLPWLQWVHKFHAEGDKPPHPVMLLDKIRNYLIGFLELGLDEAPIIEHFGEAVVTDAKRRGLE